MTWPTWLSANQFPRRIADNPFEDLRRILDVAAYKAASVGNAPFTQGFFVHEAAISQSGLHHFVKRCEHERDAVAHTLFLRRFETSRLQFLFEVASRALCIAFACPLRLGTWRALGADLTISSEGR